MSKGLNKEILIDYLLVFFIIALSGFPVFSLDPLTTPFLLLIFIVSLIIFKIRGKIWNKFVINYVLIFIIITIGQAITFSFFPTITVLGYLIRILLAYCIIQITGKEFIKYYINIIFFFTIISFFFYFSTLINPDFERYFTSHITPLFSLPQSSTAFYKMTPNIIIFNFNSDLDIPWGLGFIRNSGPFWEPGAFSGFLIIALIFNIIYKGILINRKNIAFIIAILTTCSTSGYIALFALCLLYLTTNKSLVIKLSVIPVILALFYLSYTSLSFLNSKVEKGIKTVDNSNTGNRFVSGLTDLKDIKNYWLFGRGFNAETRYNRQTNLLSGIKKHRNNGITALGVNIGLIGLFLYFYFIFLTIKRLCITYNFSKLFAYYGLVVIFIIGFSEGYFTKVFFILLTMLFISYKKTTELKQINH